MGSSQNQNTTTAKLDLQLALVYYYLVYSPNWEIHYKFTILTVFNAVSELSSVCVAATHNPQHRVMQDVWTERNYVG